MRYRIMSCLVGLRVSVLIVASGIIAHSAAGTTLGQEPDASESEPGDNELAASLHAGLLENNRSLSLFDVTFKAEYMVNRTGSELTTSLLKVRYANSVDRGLFVISRTADHINDDQELRSTNSLTAYLFDSTPNATKINAAGQSTLRFPSVAIRNWRVGVPSFHSFGFVRFPHSSPFLVPDDPYWTSLTIPNDDTVAFSHGDNHARVIRRERSGDRVVGIASWIFNLKTLLPENRTYYYIHTETGKRELKEVEDYTWQEFAGVYVPTRIRSEVKQIAVDRISGAQLPYSQIYDASFVWKSVNTKLPNELFLLKTLSTMKDVQALIDGDLAPVTK